MILVIGSDALRIFGAEVVTTHRHESVHDIDIIARKEDIARHLKHLKPTKVAPSEDASHVYALGDDALMQTNAPAIYEYEVAWKGSTGDSLLTLIHRYPEGLVKSVVREGFHYYIASPQLIYTLKMSHRYKKNSPHFLKTMRDIQSLRAQGFGVIPEVLQKWYKKRIKETYNYKHPKLMGVKKGEFFSDDGISYVYDHDSIHEAVATMEKPAYSRFQPEGEEIGTSKEMFFAQPRAVQLLAVLEEAYVLSLERSIIPFGTKDDAEKRKYAFDMALSKVCTSITSGWFREFAWENFDAVNELFDPEYVDRFFRAVDAGNVKLFERSSMQ